MDHEVLTNLQTHSPFHLDMNNKRCALVTGVSRGIGRGIALRLARDGYDIAGCFNTAEELAEKTRTDIANT